MTDEDRDAHLRAALRHAPDAQLQPPPALSELILKEARAKARDAASPARVPRHPLLGIWDWLARPSVATGFAGVMVATLIGLMWWDQPMDEAMPRPPAPAAATAPAPAPVVSPPPAAPIAEAARPAPPPQPTQAPQRKSVPAAKPASPAAPAPEQAAREEAAAPGVLGAAQPSREAAPPVALAAPPPAPAPAAAAADTATAGAAAMSRAKSFDEVKRQRSMASADTLNNKAAKAEAREAEARSIAQVRAAIAAEPTRWVWQRSGAAAQGMNDAVYAWLAQLESATGTRWQPRAERDTTAPIGRELRLLRDGRVQHSLRLSEQGVSWESGQNAWHVELTAAQLAELQTALDQAAP